MSIEGLLNKLIEKGWEPFGDERIAPYVKIDCRQIALISFYESCDDGMYQWLFDTDIRTVLSKESGLWQFVCENKLIVKKRQGTNRQGGYPENCFDYKDYEYRLIESALKDESELESFILDSIKV